MTEKRRRKKSEGRVRMARRTFLMIIFIIAIMIICGRLVYLQVIDSSDQYARQVDQVVTEESTTASRGNIYDRNGNILAQDSSAKAVYVIPYDVTDADKLATELSEKLGLEKNSVLDKINRLEDDKVEVKSNVDSTAASKILQQITSGITYENGSIYAIPDEVKDAKKAAKVLSSNLDNLEYDDAYDYVTRKENSTVLIKSKVDNSLASEILNDQSTKNENGETESTNGVELVEDHRRYYTNGNFASYVLGFTNDNYDGVVGIESTYNDWLSGDDGVVYFQKDANGNTIPSQTKVVKQAEKGKDLTLTLDSNIQTIAEKALSSAIEEWKAKSGTAIVMDTESGEILAMATEPDYDLNDPYTISEDYQSKHSEDLDGKDEDEQLSSMWSNPAVSFVYEPGSTFKAITSSSALEEGVVTPETLVTCNGYININGVRVNCTGNHGTITVAEAIAQSCNPGLVQIIQKLDPNTFYRYVYDFGFGKTTGIELNGEEAGLMTRVFQDDGSINLLDYSTLSFGQGMATTPIQLLSALNCVVNDGYYCKPTLISTSNEGITSNRGNGSTKQIISTETSSTMRQIMEKVVTENSDLADLAEGYSIGGKTGTAQKIVDGEYSETKYVTSFFCYGPVDDPKYSVIVTLDEPDPSAYGSTSAAPVGIEIMKNLLDYSSEGANATTELQKNSVTVPDLVGQELDFAEQILEEKGISYRVDNSADGSIVTSQSIEQGTTYDGKTQLVLTVGKSTDDENTKVTVPDLTGMNIQEANETLSGLGLTMKISGSGFATSQDPAAGTEVEKNSTVNVTFSQ